METINRLNVIHVAGTKGKGSTCAFIDSFLRAHTKRTGFPSKVGLYTSPHLIYPEERIRINFEPLSQELFKKYVFEVDDILSFGGQKQIELRPRYLQFFALLAFHTFIREGVDAAIIEAHHGGEYDSTNFVEKPCVTAVTTLGLDHVKQLGSTIESIAWHKGGIFKTGAAAISANQKVAAIEVLKERALAKGTYLQTPDVGNNIPSKSLQSVQLLRDVQRINCTVALAVAESYLQKAALKTISDYGLKSSDIAQAIENFSWAGRFQFVLNGQNQWYLDSAHNEMSVGVAAEWFIEASKLRRLGTLNHLVLVLIIF